MTRRPTGALLTVEEIYALIIMVGGRYVLLDTAVARLLKLNVRTLYGRVWRRLAPSCGRVPSECYVFERNSGHDDEAHVYTLLGILEAIKVSSQRSTALAERILEAFDIKEGERRAFGLLCPRRHALVPCFRNQ
jgi:hypothetical protein